MKFSVIIVNYASWPLTLRCIEALQQTRYGDFEIFVVDNDSVEPPEVPSWVHLIRNKENVGFAVANNMASPHRAEILLSSQTPTPWWRGTSSSIWKHSSQRTRKPVSADRGLWTRKVISSSRRGGRSAPSQGSS